MTLEELVHSWFTNHEGVAGRLARYDGKPAIFYQTHRQIISVVGRASTHGLYMQ